MKRQSSPISISERFCGPPKCGNGGYVAGLMAKQIKTATAVRLLMPCPLETELKLEETEQGWLLSNDTKKIAQALPRQLVLDIPAPPRLEQAAKASKECYGFIDHPFPECFVCGPNRAEGDGLRIFPGPIQNSSIVAAPWTTDDSLAEGDESETQAIGSEFIWAALDSTSSFPLLPAPEQKALVLGELHADILSTVNVNETLVAYAWPIEISGMKHISGVAIANQQGLIVGKAKATWFAVDRSMFSND